MLLWAPQFFPVYKKNKKNKKKWKIWFIDIGIGCTSKFLSVCYKELGNWDL